MADQQVSPPDELLNELHEALCRGRGALEAPPPLVRAPRIDVNRVSAHA
jgi:hypothetical protein